MAPALSQANSHSSHRSSTTSSDELVTWLQGRGVSRGRATCFCQHSGCWSKRQMAQYFRLESPRGADWEERRHAAAIRELLGVDHESALGIVTGLKATLIESSATWGSNASGVPRPLLRPLGSQEDMTSFFLDTVSGMTEVESDTPSSLSSIMLLQPPASVAAGIDAAAAAASVQIIETRSHSSMHVTFMSDLHERSASFMLRPPASRASDDQLDAPPSNITIGLIEPAATGGSPRASLSDSSASLSLPFAPRDALHGDCVYCPVSQRNPRLPSLAKSEGSRCMPFEYDATRAALPPQQRQRSPMRTPKSCSASLPLSPTDFTLSLPPHDSQEIPGGDGKSSTPPLAPSQTGRRTPAQTPEPTPRLDNIRELDTMEGSEPETPRAAATETDTSSFSPHNAFDSVMLPGDSGYLSSYPSRSTSGQVQGTRFTSSSDLAVTPCTPMHRDNATSEHSAEHSAEQYVTLQRHEAHHSAPLYANAAQQLQARGYATIRRSASFAKCAEVYSDSAGQSTSGLQDVSLDRDASDGDRKAKRRSADSTLLRQTWLLAMKLKGHLARSSSTTTKGHAAPSKPLVRRVEVFAACHSGDEHELPCSTRRPSGELYTSATFGSGDDALPRPAVHTVQRKSTDAVHIGCFPFCRSKLHSHRRAVM